MCHLNNQIRIFTPELLKIPENDLVFVWNVTILVKYLLTAIPNEGQFQVRMSDDGRTQVMA